MREGEELVLEPFQRLIEDDKLMAYKHEGFWRSMDTLRDWQSLEDMVEKGDMPWEPQVSRAAPAQSCLQSPADERRWLLRVPANACPCSASAPTPTTSRSAPAARILAHRRRIELDVHWCVLVGRRKCAAAEAARLGARFPRTARRAPRRRRATSTTASFPRRAGRSRNGWRR